MTAYSKILLSFLFIYTLSIPVSYSQQAKLPQKHLYYIGGGGEPSGVSTIFDENLMNIAPLTDSSGWKSTISFNGGHAATETIIKYKFSNSKKQGAFTAKNYNLIIDEMIEKLEKGKLGPSDRLMLVIDSHGAKKDMDEKTHSIALTGGKAENLLTLEGAETVRLDRLDRLTNLAAKNNVKLAIIDTSCFSGNTLNVKNDKVCMISASGTDQYSYSGMENFTRRFFSKLRPGMNLEKAFLEARSKGNYPDFPMISTSEGEAVNKTILKHLSPFLLYNNGFSTQYYAEEKSKFEKVVCTLDKNYNDLNQILGSVKATDEIAQLLVDEDLGKLKKALKNYRDFQKKFENTSRERFDVAAEVKSILEKNFKNEESLWKGYYPLDILDTDYALQISNAEKRLALDPTSTFTKNKIEDFKKKKILADTVRSNLNKSSLDKLNRYSKVMESAQKETWDLTAAVGREARVAYDFLYRNMNAKKSNPCRDFVL